MTEKGRCEFCVRVRKANQPTNQLQLYLLYNFDSHVMIITLCVGPIIQAQGVDLTLK